MKRFVLIGMVSVVLLAGCAGNQALQPKVDALEARTQEQDKQIAHLKEELAAKGGEDKPWDWTNVWNSDTVQDLRLRLQKCWADLKTAPGK